MGLGFLIPAFLAILTGGAGELMGVVTGGVVVGGSQSLVARVASPAVAELVVLGLAILVIRLLPNGLVGQFRRRR
jgi:branched-subunit amino acid ABC-type transport system permease component